MPVPSGIRHGLMVVFLYVGYNKNAMNDTSKPVDPRHKEDEADYHVATRRERERSLSLDEFLKDNDYELDAQGRPVRKQRVQEST